MPLTISKSKYVAGLQCPKLLWTHYNDKGAFPPTDAATQAIFDTGHAVGDLAKELYPNGVEVVWSFDLRKTVDETRELLKRRIPIFEASFEENGCYCRADIMVPVEGGAWDLYEVKSATKVKDVNVADVAFQTEVIESAGVKLDRLYLMHVDNRYVRQGDIDPRGLFEATDITQRARALQPEVAGRVKQMHGIIAGDQPNTPIGKHCFNPYACNLWDQCAAFLPEHNVLDLTGIHKTKAFGWIDAGKTAITDIPAGDLSTKHVIQQTAIRNGRAHVSPAEIRTWLDSLEYPLYCLDFETMNPAAPLVEGTRPYQQVPFQLSLHVINSKGAAPTHSEYLADSPGDPRPGLIEGLKAIGPTGTILAYNMQFESRIIGELAEAFPTEASFLRGLDGRFQDLMDPFKRFWYHDARQHGSCSLKAVLPVLTGTTYDGMAIAEGGQAQREFQRAVFGDVEAAEKVRVLQALRDYCRQDTQALVDILEALEGVV